MSITKLDAHDRHEGMASIDRAMEELKRFPRSQWLDLARSDQSNRWRRGLGVPAEVYFLQLPEVRANVEESLVLICGEILLRREAGETPEDLEYRRRFPDLDDEIGLQMEVERILGARPEGAVDSEDALESVELPGYQFLEQLGAGASGVVYQARQESLGRFVAIKVVRLRGADTQQIARQRQEAEILARLNHPNIVHIFEVREYHGCLYLVMEYVSSVTLADRIQGRPTAATDSARMALTLADAVHAMHKAGVLHRDLKPSNILQPAAGELKITDFGLAKLQSGGNLLTTSSSVLGTPCYMAPEQAIGDAHSIGPAADVYSLGVILYELLTGRPPFLGATVLDTLSLIRTAEPVSPRRLRPQMSRDLETICLKCLEKIPKQRYETAFDLAEDLRRYLGGQPILARPPGAVERFGRLVKRKPAASAAVACCLVLAGVVAATVWANARERRRLAAQSLVESIATADAQALSGLLDKIPPQSDIVLPLIRAKLSDANATDPQWTNLSLAELAADPEARGDALLEYLPAARPAELSALVRAFAGRAAAVRSQMWTTLEDKTATVDARLNLACLAAQVDPEDPRWTNVAPTVVRALVRQHPLDMGAFTTALWPVRKALVPSLVTLHSDGGLEPIAREVATGILARFAADEQETLVDVIVEATPSEFRLLLPALQKHASHALAHLEAVAHLPANFEQVARAQSAESRHDVERYYDQTERRRAIALIAMWRLGNRTVALEAMDSNKDPALRSWLIELLAPLGVPANTTWTDAKTASDGPMRQALLLALGQQDLNELTGAEQERLSADVAEMYRSDADAGVHSACRWLLQTRLHAGESVTAIDEAVSSQLGRHRGWYAGPNGHLLATFIGTQTFTMGSPPSELSREEDEAAHEQTIDHSFAVGIDEVTISQFTRFREKYFNTRYSATEDCPANNVTWFDAAAYCRWLDEQAGVPEDQMCFPPVNEIGPGMRLPANWIERTGYRLPTEAEWEFACRGGATASRFCGEGKELLSRYAWFIENSDDHAWPVGQLKPNNFGLFDMMGNVAERCHDALAPYPGEPQVSNTATTASELIISPADLRIFRGANFGDAEHNLRHARRNANSVQDQWALIGFRVARTLEK